MALSVGLMEQSFRSNSAKVVTDCHADELVHGPNEERDNEPSQPCPAADGENIPVREIEDKKRYDVKKEGLSASEWRRDQRTEKENGSNVPK
jgi:hypothetical protein